MSVAYPESLRGMLTLSRSRSQPAAFSMAEARRGFGYVRAVGTDTPVFWDGTFRFTAADALIFQLWFTQDINRGIDDFTLPIRTEFGLLTHTCRFLPDSLLDTSQDGSDVFTYRAKIMARAQVIPQEYLDAAALITGLPAWESWARYLDSAMTAEMPPG